MSAAVGCSSEIGRPWKRTNFTSRLRGCSLDFVCSCVLSGCDFSDFRYISMLLINIYIFRYCIICFVRYLFFVKLICSDLHYFRKGTITTGFDVRYCIYHLRSVK